MPLYQVRPHWNFDIEGIDHDNDLSCFVMAPDTRTAVKHWCEFMCEIQSINLELDQIMPAEFDERRKDLVIIDHIGIEAENVTPRYIPWEDLTSTTVSVKEVEP